FRTDKRTAETAPDFLPPSSERLKALSAMTDANGQANFAADDLVLGGEYDYFIIPPQGGDLHLTKDGRITIGLLEKATERQGPYLVHENLDDTGVGLRLI